MANVIPLQVANDLASLYNDAQRAALAYNSGRAIALKMLGLDPTKQYGIDFATGLITDPPTLSATVERPAPAVTTDTPSDVVAPADPADHAQGPIA